MDKDTIVQRSTYAGLFLVTCATLTYEILLTRIFSVTMWYHFAFVAISVALFGMTVGAIIVYLYPAYFCRERIRQLLGLSSLLFSISVVLSFMTHLCIPFVVSNSGIRAAPVTWLFSVILIYVVISIPFIFSGICVCLALTKFPANLSKLYAADLAGAAIGCIVVIYALDIMDGPTTAFVVALLASLGSLFFVSGLGLRRMSRTAIAVSIFLALFILGNIPMTNRQIPLLQLMWVKGVVEPRPIYQEWNCFSRIAVHGDPNEEVLPLGWGLSPTCPERKIRQLSLRIDAQAETPLTHYDKLDELDFLKYDVVNIVHYIRHNGNVLVVGTGGGRDILSALVFGQKSIVGVEINGNIVKAVNKRFGNFTGHLDKKPQVVFVTDEARSYIARRTDKFDIIQISLIDTWAATAAGAFALSENSLYTIEAWQIFLKHLTPDGVLTVSRWYFRDRPGEMYRLASLAAASLRKAGVNDPERHILIVRCMRHVSNGVAPDGTGTLLVSGKPFSAADIATMKNLCQKMHFDLVLSPGSSLDPTFTAITTSKDLNSFYRRFPLNITPPTDNNPFFFLTLRLKDMLHSELWHQGGETPNMIAVVVLGVLQLTVIGLVILCIIVPLMLTTKKNSLQGTLPLFIFFIAIGLGFMLVEISLMQRLNIFLGHPTYGLSVTLFALLLSSGLGSYLTERVNFSSSRGRASWRLFALVCVLAAAGVLAPHAITAFQASLTSVRILVSTVILLCLGLFMGMAFPLGMKMASEKSSSITPWLWGINGAASVCASVFAVVLALSFSISTAFWTGFSCYVVALIAFVSARR